MVAGELADLAGKADRAIGKQDLGLADVAGVKQDLARRRKARRILVAEAEIERAKRDPARLAAPPHMDQALAIGQQRFNPGTSRGRRITLEPRRKGERPRLDAKIRHLLFESSSSTSRITCSWSIRSPPPRRRSPPQRTRRTLPL